MAGHTHTAGANSRVCVAWAHTHTAGANSRVCVARGHTQTGAIIGGIIVIVELSLTLALPFLIFYNILMNRRVVYADLYFMCPGVYLRNTIFTALSCQMGAVAAILVVSDDLT
jgi:hypothetical protein